METTFSFDDVLFYESIKMTHDFIELSIFIVTGKDGDYFVTISPTLDLSGYGDTEEEAQESFNLSARLFLENLMKLSHNERQRIVRSLGFRLKPNSKKEYSKSYVDEDGMLHGFEEVSNLKRYNSKVAQTA